jgi:hypothetical protein
VLLQLKGNLDPKERFHVQSSVGRALILLGAVEEYREPPKTIQAVQWSARQGSLQGQYPPVIHVYCPNCSKSEFTESQKGTAHETVQQRGFAHCMGVEYPPEVVLEDYLRLWDAWQNEFQPKRRREGVLGVLGMRETVRRDLKIMQDMG